MTRLKESLQKLKETDIYSLLLFALFKLRGNPEYSSLSRLVFILDKENFLNLIENFGGTTIRIPTTEELESLVFSLSLYEYVDIEHMDYDEAIKIIGHKSSDLRKVKSDYIKLKNIMKDYDFSKLNSKWD